MTEEWKDIKGYEGLYKISNYGRIIIKKTGKLKKFWIDRDGYLKTNLSINNKKTQYFVHRLVAENFLNKNRYKFYKDEEKINIDELTVNHKDGNKQNNKIENLEWCTNRYNVKYYYENDTNGVKRKNYKQIVEEIVRYLNKSNKICNEEKEKIMEIIEFYYRRKYK